MWVLVAVLFANPIEYRALSTFPTYQDCALAAANVAEWYEPPPRLRLSCSFQQEA